MFRDNLYLDHRHRLSFPSVPRSTVQRNACPLAEHRDMHAIQSTRHRRAYLLAKSKSWLVCLLLLLVILPSILAADPVAQAPQPTPSANGNAVAPAAGGGAAATTSGNSTGVNIPSSAAAGGITITQPQQTAAQSYYKIAQGISVTIGWNFTSVLSYPTSLVVQAYCSQNSNTYTLASSLPGTATAFTWAPWAYDQSAAQAGQPQLIQATYRLQIFDERGMSVGAKAGLFQPNTKVEFALYQPKPYTPISAGWVCSGCNAAATGHVSKPVWAALAAVSVALLCIPGDML